MTRSALASPALQRLAQQLEPALRRRFLAALGEIRNQLPLEELARALATGNVTQAEALAQIRTWPERFGGLAIDLRAGFRAGTHAGETLLSGGGFGGFSFQTVDSYTVEYARRRLPPLVQRIQQGAREAIREVTREAVEGRWTPFELAESIRDWIGLTGVQTRAVIAFEQDLVDRGIDPVKIRERVDRYETAQLKLRAEVIARTEIQTAANAGQLETYREAVRQGVLPQDVRKRWIVAADERLCETCENIGASEPVGLHQVFTYDDGRAAETVFGEALYAPPQHPNCRCTLVMETETET